MRGFNVNYNIECEREEDGRWLAEVIELPGVMAYGATSEAPIRKVEALALRVIAERLDHDESAPSSFSITLPKAA